MKGVGKVAMVGPGAVGGYYGSRLALAGQEIHFLFRSSYQDILREGLWLVHHEEKGRKEKVDSLHAHCRADEIGPCDWVVVASKTTANQDLAENIAPLIGNETRLLTLQNGMGNVENLADCFGAERTILAGLCFTCINRTAPHIIESLLAGYVQFGQFNQRINEDASDMIQAFETAGVKIRVAEFLDEALWRKLCWNIPFNGLSIVAGGITTDQILADSHLRKRARDLMIEVQFGAKAFGIDIETSFLNRQFELTEPMGAYKPSSLIDFLDGKPVEVDSIWGEALFRGRSKGVHMPELENLYTQLKNSTVASDHPIRDISI